MFAHLVVLTLIHLVRGLGGLALAALFLHFSVEGNVPADFYDLSMSRRHALEPGDLTAFRAIGLGIAALSLTRLGHAGFTLLALGAVKRGRRSGFFGRGMLRRSRQLGRLLAWIDLIDLTFFPVTTACGLYGILVYGHFETIDLFEAKFSPAPA